MSVKTGILSTLAVIACGMASAAVYTSRSYVQGGLIAQWDGIDNAGTGVHDSGAAVWKDLKGNYDLTLIGSGAWSAGGDSLVVSGPSAVGETAGPEYKTIEIVYKMTNSGGRILFANGDGVMYNSELRSRRVVVFDESGTIAYFKGDGAGKRILWTYDADAIRHMAATFNGPSVYDTFCDGFWRNDSNRNNAWNLGEGKIMIGGRNRTETKYGWYGQVYSIRLYNRMLTPSEIAVNYMVDKARFFPDPPPAETGTLTFTNMFNSASSYSVDILPLWGDAASWTNSTGSNPAVTPTNGENVAFVPIPEGRMRNTAFTCRLIGTDGNTKLDGTNAVNPIVGSVTGPAGQVIRHADPGARNGYWRVRPFTVCDPNGYKGFWEVGAYGSGYVLPVEAGSGFVPRLESFYSGARGFVNVVNEGSTAEIGDLYGHGMLQKEGGGELVVEGTEGENSDFMIKAGSLTLKGRGNDAGDSLEELLDMSALHLDASVAESIATTNAGPGSYLFVTNWADVRGNGWSAKFPTYAYSPSGQYAVNMMNFTIPGYIAPEKSPTGLNLVSFGSPNDLPGYGYSPQYNPIYGPTNCCLEIAYNGKDKAVTNVQEVFYSVRFARAARNSTVLNAGGDLSFASQSWKMFNTYRFQNKSGNPYPLHDGEFRLNGEFWAPIQYYSDVFNTMTNVMVCNAALAVATRVESLGTDRHYNSNSGGCRIGELLVFTNKLTRVQRQKVNAYLYGKWIASRSTDDVDEYDAGNVFYGEGSTGIGVPAGRRATVRNLVSSVDKVVKTGDGILEVENLLGTNVVFDVRGGEVRFVRKSGAVSTAGPAADPFIWLDAKRADTITTTTSDITPGVTYVTAWKDCRDGVDLSATAWGSVESTARQSLPTLTSYRGFPAVDFGASGSEVKDSVTNKAAMKLPNYGKRNVYAAFTVIRPLTFSSRSGNLNIFGTSSLDTYRASAYRTLVSGVWQVWPSISSAIWSINGVPTDPYAVGETLNSTNDFLVIGVSADNVFLHDGLCMANSGKAVYSAHGGGQIAEHIVYTRPISEKERRDTEAYLMAKWFGTDHPESESGPAKAILDYPVSSPAIVGSEEPDGDETEVKLITGGNGTLVKTGDGAISVGSYTNGVRNLRVEGGTLKATLGFSPSAVSLFHFDAMDESSLYTYDEVGTDSVERAFVTQWSDTRHNGTWAKPAVSYNPARIAKMQSVAATNPVLKTVEMAAGVMRRAVDFGQVRHYNATEVDGAPLYDEAPMLWNKAFLAAEVHTVAGPHTGVYNPAKSGDVKAAGGPFIGGKDLSFYHSWNGTAIFTQHAQSLVRFSDSAEPGTTCTWIDRVETSPSLTWPAGFHLLSVITSNAVPGNVSNFSSDRSYYSGGGIVMGEQIGFDRWLTDKERGYLMAHLMRKWFGESAAERVLWTNSLDSVYVAPGASFVEKGDAVMVTPSFAGGGTVTVDEMRGVSSFDLEGPLFVNGTLVVADGPISLNIDTGFDLNVPGVYPAISATSLEGVDLSHWTLTGAALSARRITSLVTDADGNVCVKVEPKGLLLIAQ